MECFFECFENLRYEAKERDSAISFTNNRPPWPWQDSNLQSPDPKSGALSIRPHGRTRDRYDSIY